MAEGLDGEEERQLATAQQQRFCATDLLYALLMDPEDPSRRARRVLDGILQLVLRKCSPSLDNSTMFHNTRKLLMSDDADGDVLVFCILMLMPQFDDIQTLMKRSFQPGNMRDTAEAARDYFEHKYVAEINAMAERTLMWPTTELNSTAVVRDFFDAAQSAYYH